MSVIGIDPSLAATGIANGKESWTIVTAPNDPARLQRIYQRINAQAAAASIDGAGLAVVEDLPTHAHGAGLTGMAQGVVRLALINCGLPYVTVPAATLKVFATGRGNASKADMRMALFQRTGSDLRDDNQVDATWLRYLGLALLNQLPFELPKTHTRAMDKIRLPIEVKP